MSLKNQYKQFIEENPIYSHWSFTDWLNYLSKEISKNIKKLKQNDKDWLEKQD
jgi:hypothetical protein